MKHEKYQALRLLELLKFSKGVLLPFTEEEIKTLSKGLEKIINEDEPSSFSKLSYGQRLSEIHNIDFTSTIKISLHRHQPLWGEDVSVTEATYSGYKRQFFAYGADFISMVDNKKSTPRIIFPICEYKSSYHETITWAAISFNDTVILPFELTAPLVVRSGIIPQFDPGHIRISFS